MPTEIAEEIFWKRYSFRVHQVEKEEEKRKALLQRKCVPSLTYLLHSFHNVGVENDEEFSWEDDDDEATASTPLSKNKVTLTASTSSEQTLGLNRVNHTRAPSSQATTSASGSPRLSSEDSFDLISSGNVSVAGDTKPPAKKEEEEEDADSDWE